MKGFVNDYLSVILLIAGFTGFFIPYPGNYASYFILAFLFTIIFASCFQIELKTDIFRVEAGKAVLFTVIRFVLIPLALFFIIRFVSPFYAFALFFLLLLPSAVASPPLTSLITKRINLSLMILALSSLAATFTIPVFVPWASEKVAVVDATDLFQTMFITVILPFFLHLPLRKKLRVKNWMISNLSYITAACLSLILIFAVAKNRQTLLQQPDVVVVFGLTAIFFYIGLFVLGWFMMPPRNFENKATYSISSGLNNIGLGISLATIYLPPLIAVFCIMAQFAWIISLTPMRLIMKRIGKRDLHND